MVRHYGFYGGSCFDVESHEVAEQSWRRSDKDDTQKVALVYQWTGNRLLIILRYLFHGLVTACLSKYMTSFSALTLIFSRSH